MNIFDIEIDTKKKTSEIIKELNNLVGNNVFIKASEVKKND